VEECKPLLLGSATNAGDVVCCFATDQSHLSYVASLCSSLGLGFAALDFPGSLCRGIGTGASAGAGSVDSGRGLHSFTLEPTQLEQLQDTFMS
jgi:hypothetical protein